MSQIHGRRDASRTFSDDELARAAWPKTAEDQAIAAEYRRVMDEELAERREDEEKRSSEARYEAGDHPGPWSVKTEPSGYSNGQDHVYIVDGRGRIVTLISYPAQGGWYRYAGANKGIAQAICAAMNRQR